MTVGRTLSSAGTSFVGRERELAALAEVVAGERLVTLHGPGGAGKTRLALELVARGEPGGGVLFADLGPLARGSDPWPSLMQLVGGREEPGTAPGDVVARELADRDALVVLDNCEHVLGGARDVAERLLEDCGALTVLATSREPLGLAAERVWPVPPLSVPPEGAGLAETLEHDAARLFAERAARALPGLELRDEHAASLARVCRRLDGIPLAIELAAARIKVMGPEEIAERLDDRFRLLAREDLARPPRHRTLRALVDWSYELLEPAERLLLDRVSVFAGGFELDAVESVCAGHGLEPDGIVDLLAGLVDKALVARGERRGRARFRLHETIREYASKRLASEDDPETVSARHLVWCGAFAAEADDAWLGEGGTAWLDRARAEQDNVRRALRFGLDIGRAEAALALAWRFVNFWSVWGQATEGGKWLEACLDATAGAPPAVDRARALTRAGDMASMCGHPGRARLRYEGALEIGARLDDPVRRGVALLALADLDRSQGRLGKARGWAEDGLRAIEPTGDRERVRWLVEALGRIALAEGDVDSACAAFEASRTEAVALGNEIALPLITRQLGEAERAAGDRVAARMHLEEALGLARRIDDKEAEATALLSLGRLELDAGAPAKAHSRLVAALRIADEAAVRHAALDGLDAIAQASAELGEPGRGARLLGAVEALRELLGTPPEPRERGRLERVRAALDSALGPDAFAAARGAGRALAWRDAVAEGLRARGHEAPEARGPIEVVMRRRGDMWALSRSGRDSLLRDSKGIRYLAELVAAEGREIHVLELAGAGLDEAGSELLDDAARSAYRTRLGELDEELEEAERFSDLERASRLKDERDALIAELSSAIGLGGRPRRTPSSVERARKAVSNRIRDCIGRIEREDPELGAHLRGSVQMGTECAYRPEPRSPWSLRVA